MNRAMRLSWEWKLWLINTVCQSLFFIYTSVTLFIALTMTLPYIHQDDPNALFNRKVFAWFLVLNVVGNYLCIKFKSKESLFCHQSKIFEESHVFSSNQAHVHVTDTGNGLLPSKGLHSNGENENLSDYPDGQDWSRSSNNHCNSLAGWVGCKHCQKLVPARAKHCTLCRACILKRDHHCFFAGCCIGFHNQRYFIIFCLYGSIGAIYSAFTTSTFLRAHYTSLQDWGVFAYFIPVLIWFWTNGSASGLVVLLVLFLYWSTFTSFICVYFFLLQIFLVCRGQTKLELKRGIFTYTSNFVNNFMSVFGPLRFCFVGFLVPSPCIGYFGNGKSWDELSCSSKIA